MPLYLCPICGWTTTAAAAQAIRAHQFGVPGCDGVLEEVAYAGKRVAGSLTPVGTHARGQASRGAAPSKTPDP